MAENNNNLNNQQPQINQIMSPLQSQQISLQDNKQTQQQDINKIESQNDSSKASSANTQKLFYKQQQQLQIEQDMNKKKEQLAQENQGQQQEQQLQDNENPEKNVELEKQQELQEELEEKQQQKNNEQTENNSNNQVNKELEQNSEQDDGQKFEQKNLEQFIKNDDQDTNNNQQNLQGYQSDNSEGPTGYYVNQQNMTQRRPDSVRNTTENRGKYKHFETSSRYVGSRPNTTDKTKRQIRSTTSNSQWLRGGGESVGKQFREIKKSRKQMESDALGLVHRLALIKQLEDKTNKKINKTIRETDKLYHTKKLKQLKYEMVEHQRQLQSEELEKKRFNVQYQREIMKQKKEQSLEVLQERNSGAFYDVKKIKQRCEQIKNYQLDVDLQRKQHQAYKIKTSSGMKSQLYQTFQVNLSSRRTADTKYRIRQEKAKKLKINQDVRIMDTLELQMKQKLQNQQQLYQQAIDNQKTLQECDFRQIQKMVKQKSEKPKLHSQRMSTQTREQDIRDIYSSSNKVLLGSTNKLQYNFLKSPSKKRSARNYSVY